MLLALVNAQMNYRRDLLRHFMEISRIRRLRNDMVIVAALSVSKPKKRKRWWKRRRSEHWWKNTVPGFDDEEWYENFRMRKGTFEWLCSRLDPVLKPHPNPVAPGRPILTTEKRVAIALYKLAHLAEYKVVGNQFGVHKSSVHNCLYSFCIAICELLGRELIKFPDEGEAEEVAKRFETVTYLPNIIGAIDGSHIPTTPPADGNADFVNRKCSHSIVLQAIVDDQYLFRDVSCKSPGSCHDVDALKESNFYRNVENIMPKGTKSVNGREIPYMILGDPAYPLLHWLMQNYNYDRNISPEMDSFNVYLNKGRVVVENAFGRLKARWRILCRASEVNYKFMATIVLACCILHNICEMSKENHIGYETRMQRWESAAESDAQDMQPPTQVYDAENIFQAEDMRDHLMLYLSRNCELLSSIRGRFAVL